MHNVLNIDEVLRHIFSFVAPKPPTLLNMAIVCRNWFEPAIDFQWRDLDGLGHLLDILVYQGLLSKTRSWSGVRYVRLAVPTFLHSGCC